MDVTGDTLYQIVRILFALSLLGFLFLVIRVTMKDLQQPVFNAIRMKPAAPRAELVVVAGEDGVRVPDGLVYEIQGVAILGRAQSSRVVLDDPSVSAQHAILRPADDSWAIEDLGSRNGTMVNGRPISIATAIDCGDSIQLGRVRLRLMC